MLLNAVGPMLRIIVLCLVVIQLPTRSALTGRVLSESGKPLPGVSIAVVRADETEYQTDVTVETDKTGFFKIQDQAKILLARKAGFLPTFRLVNTRELTVDLVMRPATAEAPLSLPECGPTGREQRLGLPVGFSHRWVPPGNVSLDIQSGIDTSKTVIAYRGREKESMTIWNGMYGFQQPRLDALLQTVTFSSRSIERLGRAEMRGTTKTGRRWRWIPFTGGYIDYYDASPEASEFFDRLISQVCAIP